MSDHGSPGLMWGQALLCRLVLRDLRRTQLDVRPSAGGQVQGWSLFPRALCEMPGATSLRLQRDPEEVGGSLPALCPQGTAARALQERDGQPSLGPHFR